MKKGRIFADPAFFMPGWVHADILMCDQGAQNCRSDESSPLQERNPKASSSIAEGSKDSGSEDFSLGGVRNGERSFKHSGQYSFPLHAKSMPDVLMDGRIKVVNNLSREHLQSEGFSAHLLWI